MLNLKKQILINFILFLIFEYNFLSEKKEKNSNKLYKGIIK